MILVETDPPGIVFRVESLQIEQHTAEIKLFTYAPASRWISPPRRLRRLAKTGHM